MPLEDGLGARNAVAKTDLTYTRRKMPVSVVLRVSCDAFKTIGGVKKKCGRHDEFEEPNIVACRWAAEAANWCFDTTKKDKAFCPECGPALRPHCYSGKK